jgi:transcriptional regulator with XRE-family HTH domain
MEQRETMGAGVIEAEENFLIDCQFLIQDLLNRTGISRTELARRAGISKSRLSQILSAEANPSVKTFARLFHALGAVVAPKVVEECDDTSRLVPDQDGWEVFEQEPAALPKTTRANADSWLGASNDNCTLVDGGLQSFRLRAA